MLQIKLGQSSETADSRTVDNLALEDMQIAKSVGLPPAALLVKTVGRKAGRSIGERSHFCLNCDFPIAVYGRLSPCAHVFCIGCAESANDCFVCEKSIEKVETINRNEDLFVCSAPLCLKSFVVKDEFESHVRESHGNVVNPSPPNCREKENGNYESSTDATRQASPEAAASSESTTVIIIDLISPPKPAAAAAAAASAPALDSKVVIGPTPRPKAAAFSSPIPVTKIHDREDKFRRPLLRDPPPMPMMQQQQQQPRPFFVPPIRTHPHPHPHPHPNLFGPIVQPPPPQVFYGGGPPPFDMGTRGSNDNRPSILGFPPNMQPLPPPTRGVFPPLHGPMIPPPPPPPPPHQGAAGRGDQWGNDGRAFGRWNN